MSDIWKRNFRQIKRIEVPQLQTAEFLFFFARSIMSLVLQARGEHELPDVRPEYKSVGQWVTTNTFEECESRSAVQY